MADPPPLPDFVSIVGAPLIGFLLNLFLCGVLLVQVYIYHLAFPKDQWSVKAIVYVVFILELLQTIMKCVDRFHFDVQAFTNPNILNDGQMSWFSVGILTPITSAIVQGFFGYRIYIFSKTIVPSIVVWIPTCVGLGGGLASGILSAGLTLSETPAKTKVTVYFFVVGTVVTDVLIAVLLSIYLQKMKTGVQQTDRLVSKIVRLTVETGALTAIWSVLLVVLFFTTPGPWFFIFSDSISKIYGNNLMVMFNRRIEFRAHGGTSLESIDKGTAASMNSSRTAQVPETMTWRVAAPADENGELDDWELTHRKRSTGYV